MSKIEYPDSDQEIVSAGFFMCSRKYLRELEEKTKQEEKEYNLQRSWASNHVGFNDYDWS